MNEEWSAYYNLTKDNPPSKTAVQAMEQFGEKCGIVLDLGCGAGVDALYFLSKGWNVLTVDAHTEYLSAVREEMPIELQKKLDICQMAFEQLHIEKAVDGIIANFSLPFCNPQYFDSMWKEIVRSIKPSGVFSGVFFGDRDGWAMDMQEERTFRALEEVKELFVGFQIIQLQEEEWDGTCCGENGAPIPKHWHIFRVVAKKSSTDFVREK